MTPKWEIHGQRLLGVCSEVKWVWVVEPDPKLPKLWRARAFLTLLAARRGDSPIVGWEGISLPEALSRAESLTALAERD